MDKKIEKINIIAIKTDNGYYITIETTNDYEKYRFPSYFRECLAGKKYKIVLANWDLRM